MTTVMVTARLIFKTTLEGDQVEHGNVVVSGILGGTPCLAFVTLVLKPGVDLLGGAFSPISYRQIGS